MFDAPDRDDGDRIFRSSLPGWQSSLSPGRRRWTAEALFAPGRGWLEGSILASAIAIMAPISSLVAVVLALMARRAGNRRWLAALLAAVWCGALGSVVRAAMGIGFVP